MKNGFLAFLKEFDRNHAWQINAAIVIRDSDCQPPGQIEQQMQGTHSASGFKPRFAVEFFAVQCVLESWLLSDLHAIHAASGRMNQNLALPPSIQIPNSHSPQDKSIFVRVLSHFGLPATPAVYASVASNTDLARVGSRCSYFRSFQARIASLQ